MRPLRYPLDNIREGIDYLEILVIKTTYGRQTQSTTSFNRSRTIVGEGQTPQPQVVNDINGEYINLIQKERFTNKRSNIEQTIILPMPSNITDSNQVSYSDDSLDAVTAQVAGYARNLMESSSSTEIIAKLKNFVDSLGGNTGNLKTIFLGKLAADAAQLPGVGNITLNQILARGENQILNPNMELLFNGPTIRNFKFSFKMTPRDPDEGEHVKSIIRTFKKNMASKTDGTEYFLGSPNIFELRYRTSNKNNRVTDHEFLHRFKQCALTDMSVNYTGENIYATYRDGTPVSIIMDLTFKELEPIYSSDYTDDIGGVGY